jgi:hypothetical protein
MASGPCGGWQAGYPLLPPAPRGIAAIVCRPKVAGSNPA